MIHILALLNATGPANDNTAVIVGVLFGVVTFGVVAVLLVLGIVCGVCKLSKRKKHPTSTKADPTAENRSVTHYKCMLHIWSTNLGMVHMPLKYTSPSVMYISKITL